MLLHSSGSRAHIRRSNIAAAPPPGDRLSNTAEKWTQISRYWVTKLMHDKKLFVDYSERVRARVFEMDQAFLRRN